MTVASGCPDAQTARVNSKREHPAKRAVDAVTGAIPNSVVRWAASRGAPVARLSGHTSLGSAALAQALATLAQPPRRLWSRGSSARPEDVAERLGRTPEEVRRWQAAGMLTRNGDRRPGPIGRDGFDRAALIDLALRSGAQESALAQAASNNNLVWAALESVLTARGSMTGHQVADNAGVEPQLVHRVWQSLGLPTGALDAAGFDRRDVRALRTLGALTTVFDDDDIAEAASVIGRAMSEVSSAFVELFRRRLAEPLVEAGATDTDIVVRLAAMRDLLVPTMAPLLEIALERHLDSAIRSEVGLRLEQLLEPGTGHRVLSVGFADLVGFTSTSQQLTALQVRNLAASLHRIADAAVAEQGGRVVKSIGDAVMFTAPTPVQAGVAATQIVSRVAADDDLPPVRVGIAHGPVLPGYADYFGATVNLASRLCAAAAAGEVLVAGEAGILDEQDWQGAGLQAATRKVRRLKGIDGTVHAVAVTAG